MLSKITQWFDDRTDAAIHQQLGYASVYMMRSGSDDAYRLGVSTKVLDEIRRAQNYNWKTLSVPAIVWAADAKLARRIANIVMDERRSMDFMLNDDWFSLEPVQPQSMLEAAAHKLGIPVMSHAQMLALVSQVRNKRTDRILNAVMPSLA